MADSEGIWSEIRIDESDFDTKMRKIDRDLEKTQQKAKRGAGRGSVIAAGVAGAVAGGLVGAAAGSSPVQGILDVLLNIVAAALLPLLVATLPLIQSLTPVLLGLSDTLAPAIQFLSTKVADFIGAVQSRITVTKVNDTNVVATDFNGDGKLSPTEASTSMTLTQIGSRIEEQGKWLKDKSSSAWDWLTRPIDRGEPSWVAR